MISLGQRETVTITDWWLKANELLWILGGKNKVGGLDGRDQSKSRTSIVLKTVEIILHVEINFFLSRSRFIKSRFFNRDLTLSRYLLRSSRYIETIKTNRDYQDFLRFIKISQHFWEIFTNRQLWKVTSFHRCLLKWIKSSNLDRDLWKL